ncbi:MAG: type II toxin-antitoxin system HicA family toxin [Planctomycetes bacterium]|nr:type II toxin-antitoxin system HicA family toxin [Planctomycetota bacterium]
MNRNKFLRYPSDHNCFLHHRGGEHDIWWNTNEMYIAPIPRHKEIATGTIKSICKQLHVPVPREN